MSEYIDLPAGVGDEIETPPDLFAHIGRTWRITWDAASAPGNCLAGVTGDCLTADWKARAGFGAVYLNPPYSNPAPFLHAAVASGVPVVALIKADHSTSWWRNYVTNHAHVIPLASRVRFYYKGRPLKYVAAFPSVIAFYDGGLARGTWR